MRRNNAGRRVRKSTLHRRRCGLEQLDDRRLLAAEILLADSFESGGGTGNRAGVANVSQFLNLRSLNGNT